MFAIADLREHFVGSSNQSLCIVCSVRPIKKWSAVFPPLLQQPISSVTRQRPVLTLQWQQNKSRVQPMYFATHTKDFEADALYVVVGRVLCNMV